MTSVNAFVAESNRIEGIVRDPTTAEIDAHWALWKRSVITVAALKQFVATVASAPLRDQPGMDVVVGAHRPPPGGPEVVSRLEALLGLVERSGFSAYDIHCYYETLHPFMDGNGRSGRALWAWMMFRDGLDPFGLPFLQRWYFQSLDASRRKP